MHADSHIHIHTLRDANMHTRRFRPLKRARGPHLLNAPGGVCPDCVRFIDKNYYSTLCWHHIKNISYTLSCPKCPHLALKTVNSSPSSLLGHSNRLSCFLHNVPSCVYAVQSLTQPSEWENPVGNTVWLNLIKVSLAASCHWQNLAGI